MNKKKKSYKNLIIGFIFLNTGLMFIILPFFIFGVISIFPLLLVGTQIVKDFFPVIMKEIGPPSFVIATIFIVASIPFFIKHKKVNEEMQNTNQTNLDWSDSNE